MKYTQKLRISFKDIGLFFLITLLISSCGFHLRGDIVLPPLYERVYIVDKGESGIGRSLSLALKRVGSEIVSDTKSATAVVTVLSDGTQRRALNVGGNQIREYELQLDILFVVQDQTGQQLAEPEKVTILRNFQNDPNNVLGKDNEEDIIRQEMIQPAIIQVLRRMKAIADNDAN
ncbi:MAG: hypothetical protein KAI17_09395 [Thiotrichaceae bacterium]|nr:hypothetical protein [Thiotrichaceae bacterium]